MPQRALGIGAAVAFLVAFLVILLVSLGSGGGSEQTAPAAQAQRPPAARRVQPAPATTTAQPARPAARAVRLQPAGTYDPPPGDGHEKDELVPLATDGDPATSWTTETYDTWGYKPGVGLVLDAGAPLRLTRLVVQTDTPGFVAEVRAGATPEGPFETVSDSRTVAATTAFPLHERAPAQFLLLWITQIAAEPGAGGAAHVSEVRALAT